ncbi:MAG: RHS repeat protein, partial [bacterium]|nr:RHS repeat protein [bacterium]
HLAGLRWQRLVQLGTAVLAVQRGAVSTAPDGSPLVFSKGPMSLDLGAMPLGLFPASGAAGSTVPTLELLGSQGSFLEGEVLSQVIGGEQITAVTFLTRAVREGQTLTLVDAGNVDAALAVVELSAEAEAHVRAGVAQGKIAWIAESQLPVDTWDTSGYVLEDPDTGAAGYFVTFERLVEGLEANIVFHSPQDLDVVTAPTDVVATIEGEAIDSWTLSYQFAGEGQPVVLATGTGSVTNATLAQFDPTLLLNGLYDIVLTARDIAGQSASKKISVSVEGNMKVGNFTLSFVDLAIPLSGLDIEIVRTYDSRDKRQGDFGIGWILDIRQGSYHNNRPPGDGWQIVNPGGPFGLPCSAIIESKSHLTTVRLSDQEIYRFRLKLVDPAVLFGGCQARAVFEWVDGPLRGTTLEIIGNDELFWATGSDFLVDMDSFEVFVPQSVRLRTRDGRIFTVHIEDGVTALEDSNGNTLSIADSGITHLNGFGIEFERDYADRIAKIVDSRGGEIVYTFDQAGDLTVFTDQELNSTHFTYEGDHRLVEIENSRGIVPVRNEYDDDGRLISTTDAFGKVITFAHDLGGRQEVITDRLGHARVLEYDGRGNVVRETDRLGRVTTRTFDARDNLLSETDPLGRTTTMSYDGNGDLVRIVDPAGNTIHLDYDTRGALLRLEDPRGGAELYAYDGEGNLTSRTDAAGNTIDFAYGARGQLQSVTDALGHVTTMTYDAAGHLIRKVDAAGAETSFDLDSAGNPLRVTTPRTTPSGLVSEVTEFIYDRLGRMTERRLPNGNVVRMIYGGFDEVEAIIDPLGRRTDFSYDEMGRLSTVSFPDETSERRTYDDEGRLFTFTDRAGRTSSFSYDAEGQLVSSTLADGTSLARAFDAGGQLVSETNARSGTTTYAYDAAGRRISVTDVLGNSSLLDYDASGNPIRVVDPKGNVASLTYDAVGRLIGATLPDGSTHQREHDALGMLESETAPNGSVTRYGYDPMGRLLSVTDALGGVTSMTYDERGNRVALTDANGRATRFEYDALGMLIRRVLPGGTAESFAYDAKGNRTHTTDVLGRATEWRYDANDRVVEKVLPGGESVTYGYTATGRLAAMTDGRGTTSYSYDSRDRLIELTNPDGRRLTYGYDADGNRTSLTAILGTAVLRTTYVYDLAGRLTTVVDPVGGSYSYSYDPNGNPRLLTYPNGVTTTYDFDGLDRLMGLTVTAADGGILHSESYTRNALGSRISITEHDGSVREYRYDALERLIEETVGDGILTERTQQFVYDAVGNRVEASLWDSSGATTTVYTYDSRDRLLTAGGATYTWDAEGNLLSRDDGTLVDFSWDSEDRLLAGSVAGGLTKAFTYDGQGRRVAVYTSDAGETTERHLLVDPSQSLSHIVVESDEAQVPQTTRVLGIGLLAALHPHGPEYQHTDGLGTIRLETDASGSVVRRHAYRAFGEPVAPSGLDDGYLFTGEPYDADLGIAYHRARWLDPAVGRFISRDPFPGVVRRPGTLHRYTYVQNDPVNRIDPTGLYAGGYAGLAVSMAVSATIGLNAMTTFGAFSMAGIVGGRVDGLILSGRLNAGAIGGSLGAGADAVYEFDSGKIWVGLTAEFGLHPLSIFAKHRSAGTGITGGFIVGMDSPRELTGRGSTATWPMSIIHLMPGALFSRNKAWGLLSQLAKRAKGRSGWTASFGFSTTGPSMFQIGLRSNDFAALATFSGEFVPYDGLDEAARRVFKNLADATRSLHYLGPEMTKIINQAPQFFEALARGYPCTSGCG